VRWLVVVVIVIIAALSPRLTQILGIAASATAIVGVQLSGTRGRAQRGEQAR
jgi:hypothetical protein